MPDFYADIAQLLTYDPGKRGLAGRVPPPDLAALTRSLTEGQRFIVLTGFPIPVCGVCETDGPPGAACIARSLIRMGGQVTIVTDTYNLPVVRAAAQLFAPGAGVAAVPMAGAEGFIRDLLQKENPTHIIAIERPGAHGGHYHNMRGERIDHCVSPTDSLFEGFGGVTVGIGDGGNEIGMGNFADLIAEVVPSGQAIAADLGCDFPLVAGVSNWWGWGIAALLSVAIGKDLMPSDDEETALLQAIIDAGAVDGITKKCELSIDGLSLGENLAVLGRLRQRVLREIG